MPLTQQLSEYIAACFSGIWVQSHEHEDALAEITDAEGFLMGGDQDCGDVEGIGFYSRYDHELIILCIDNQGFKMTYLFENLEELNKAWKEIEDEDAKYYEGVE